MRLWRVLSKPNRWSERFVVRPPHHLVEYDMYVNEGSRHLSLCSRRGKIAHLRLGDRRLFVRLLLGYTQAKVVEFYQLGELAASHY